MVGSRYLVRLAHLICAVCISCGGRGIEAAEPTQFGAVDDQRLHHAAAEPGQWFTVGRDSQGSYYSPLDQINADNVTSLGFAWEYRLGTYRGLEATPVVVDGVLYTSGIAGRVYALDARTGQKIWTFDPDNNPQSMRYPCCDVVNRGVAIKNGLLYVASLDGRLFALDASTGKIKWSVDTIVDHARAYTITAAPQLTKDLVVIGNSGADMGRGGVRGYVSAYDLKSGRFRWRFYTVPIISENNPSPEMVAAEKTWDSKRDPRVLGGGTVWNGTAYDVDLNLVYFGTGNAAPDDQPDRSPNGGDNLYAASVIALHADTGRMAWYYQTVPGDKWDYDDVQSFILEDLRINGQLRKVIMQAAKNGYFYVIDRKSGQVISAKPFTHANWSKGMDGHFHPIANPEADYAHEAKLVFPSYEGGHSWQPMSYDPKTGLVYIPVLDAPMIIGELKNTHSPVTWRDDAFGHYVLFPESHFDRAAAEATYGKLPAFDVLDPHTGRSIVRTFLTAWNPVTQKAAWVQPLFDGSITMEGGVTSTAGNLVLKGTSTGELRIYAADTGKLLHTIETGTAIMAAPATYMVAGVQYVVVMAGYGGDGISSHPPSESAALRYDNEGRILAFRLGGAPEVPRTAKRVIAALSPPPPREGSVTDVAAGGKLFNMWCWRCHTPGAVLIPDLRRMEDGIGRLETFKQIVLSGVLAAGGMERFDDTLKAHDVEQIHAYLVDQAHQLYAQEHSRAKN
jgi:quinohemoprotein ethanol dehydrogenase